MGTVRKRIKRQGATWFLDYRDAGGRRVREAIPEASTKHEAERVLHKRLASVLEGKEGLPDLTPIPFGEYAEDWFSRNRLRLKGHGYGGSTHALYRGYLDRHLLPHFGATSLRGIDKAGVERFASGLVEGGRSPKTANNIVGLLKTILRAAEEDGLIERNPARSVRPLRVPRRRVEVYTPEEAAALLAAADGGDRVLLLAAVATGLREGEQFALRWSDLDFRNATASVRRRYHKGHEDDPKSPSSVRVVALPEVLLAALADHRKRQAEERLAAGGTWRDLDLVFCGPDRRPLHQSRANRALKRAAKRAGLRALRFHDLRHTHASLLLAVGENIKTISERLGHSTVSVTLNVYSHLLPDADRNAARRMDEMLGHAQGTQAKSAAGKPRHSWKSLAPRAGIEPATLRLTAGRSTRLSYRGTPL